MPSYIETLHTQFPDAVPGTTLTRSVTERLEAEGFDRSQTLFCKSTCPDELNRTVTSFEDHWGPGFNLGGMAGIPFTRESGFTAFAHHIPVDGMAFILYASHIGITSEGEIGRVVRHGQSQPTHSCGSAVGAYNYLQNGGREEDLDPQQKYVTEIVNNRLTEIKNSEQPLARLPHVVYEQIDSEIKALVPSDFDHKTALLGGIQINTPVGEDDYFLVKEFSVVVPAENYSLALKEQLDRNGKR